ncbi:MAG: hypothetical protein H2055_07415 [Sphingopyxis sp.]|nr:hypothetical protein [Sphingopyxis sp.]
MPKLIPLTTGGFPSLTCHFNHFVRYYAPGCFYFPLSWGGSVWQAMRTRGPVRNGGRVTAEQPTTRITTDRIVARAIDGQARIAVPTERGGVCRQEKKFD